MSKNITRGFLIASALGLFLASHIARPTAQAPPSCGVDLRVLVMSADGTEADLPAIQAALDYLGTPYDVYVATSHPGGLAASLLADGCHARYQGVVLATDNLVHQLPGGSFAAALTPADAATLADYEATFKIRQVTWYTFPTPALGFNWPTGASGDPLTATATARGAQVFPYLNAGLPIPIQYSWTYLTTPLDATTAPLLTDADGHALAAIHTYPDGRENLAMTFDSNPYMTHAMLLSYGIVNWVTRGLFVGDRHVYVSPQVDDLFIDDAMWTASTACGTDVDLTGVNQRITGSDLTAVANWQTLLRSQPQTADLRVTMAFNGLGTTSAYTVVVGKGDTVIGGSTTGAAADTLIPAAVALQQHFFWVSHTYNHENLDAVSFAAAASEITQNNATADALGFLRYARHALVQPDVSGLGNPQFLSAAAANGVQYLLSDTSKPGQGNPSPNVGFWTASQPGVFVIPRRANNLFFNVATPADWAAEYNCHYNAYWGRNLSYAEILDQESGQLLAHMLRGELDPWMFHQTNLAAYDGVHTLLGDLLDATFAKFGSYTNLPILSPSMEAVGARMAARTRMRASGISARLQPGVGLVLTSPVDVTVPVTGLNLPGAENYGGQWISWIALTANVPTVAAYSVVEPPVVSAGAATSALSASTVSLAGSASDGNSPARPVTFAWMQTAGPAVTLTGASTLTPSFTTPTLALDAAPVTLAFTLTADNGSASAAASTTVVVNAGVNAPSADAGSPQTVASASAVTLAGSAADTNVPARALTYAWSQTSGPAVSLTNATSLTAGFTAPALTVGMAPITLGFTLTVDNAAVTGTATTTVTVNPPVGPPVASAGLPKTVAAGAAVALAGSATDPNLPARTLTYAWTQHVIAGEPLVALTGAATLAPSFIAPSLSVGQTAFTLTFSLLVDNGGLTDTASTTVTVDPPIGPPVATVVGPPQVVDFGAAVTIAGTATDPNVPARTLTYAWSQTSGPAVSLTNPTTLTAGFTAPALTVGMAPVTLGFTLTVDNGAATGTATTAVTVNPPVGPPVVSIGLPQTVAAGALVALAGTATDPNLPVRTLTYAWTQTVIAGEPLVALTSPTTLTPTFTAPNLTVGQAPVTFTFSLLVDNGGLSATRTTTVTVNPPIGPPVATIIGPPQIVDSGAAVTLTGGATDPNVPARTLTHAWSQSSGPAVSLINPATLTAGFTAPVLTIGMAPITLGFTLTVDNGTMTGAATTTVTVNPPVGPPVADAGLPQTVAAGALVTLAGTATDPNLPLRTLTTAWTQTIIASEPLVALTNPATLTPTFTAPNLSVGEAPVTLTFSLLVDNGGLADAKSTTVTINPPVGPPVAAIVGLPQTVDAGAPVALTGSATDPNVPARTLTHAWSQVIVASEPPVSLTNATTLTAGFVAPGLPVGAAPVTLTFALLVDNGTATSSATTTVVVNPPIGAPVATMPLPQIVEAGAAVTVSGGAIDPNVPARPLTYAWTQTGGPAVVLEDAATPVAHLIAPALEPNAPAATLSLTLTVSNGVLISTATTTVVVRPPLPALAATQTIPIDGAGSQTTPPFAVNAGDLLVAFVSSDGPAGAPQNATVSGGGLTWTNAQRANTQQGTSEVWTAVAPDAIPDVTVSAEQSATPGPDVAGFHLSLTIMTFPDARGTGASTAAGAADGAAAASLMTTSSGSLVFGVGNDVNPESPRLVPEDQVVVRESIGPAGDSHWLQGFTAGPFATVGAAANLDEIAPIASAWNFAAVEIVNRWAPSASAGPPQTAGSGAAVALTGEASDLNVPARPLTQVWSQTSGPGVALANETTLTPSFTAPIVPVGGLPVALGFSLTVSNGVLSTTSATIVQIDPIVGAPSVNAGAAQIVGAGAPVSLTGSADDPNLPPRSLSYAWTQTSGPPVALTDADTAVAHFAAPGLVVGMPAAALGFSLTVTNGTAASSASTTVTVNPPIGPPTVGAGAAQTVVSGTGITLAATAADPNVPVRSLTYQWTQTDGTPVTIVSPTAATASFAAPALGAGATPLVLRFMITADNGVSSASSTTTVTVMPPNLLTAGAPISSDGTGTRTTAPLAVNAGDLVVAFVAANGPNGSTQTATVSGAGLTWTLARRVNTQRGTSEVWWAWATTALPAATVTATLSSASNPASLTVMAFAGAGGIGATAGGNASTGAPTVSVTTTQAKSLVFGVGNDGTAARARTAVAGQQLVHEYLSSADSHWLQTLTAGSVAASGTTVQLRDSAPTADRWNFAAVEILSSRPVTISAVKTTTTSTAAVVTWTTSAPSGSRVDYGTSPDALTLVATDPGLVTAHAVALRGLTPGATYYFRVTSVDAAWTPSTSPAPPAAPLTFAAVNPAGLVAAFGFSEGAGTAVNDLTGNGNSGVIAGASWTSAGKYGQALQFDGVSNWITVEDSPSLDLTTGMTIEAWVNPATLTGWQTILYKERPDPLDAGMAWALYSSDRNAPPAIYSVLAGASGSGLWTHATGTSMLPLNTWSHVAASYDGSSVRLYVNGTLVQTLSLPGHLAVTPGPLRIGGNSPSIPYGGQFFKGAIDEIRVYNRALSQADIQADMTTRLP